MLFVSYVARARELYLYMVCVCVCVSRIHFRKFLFYIIAFYLAFFQSLQPKCTTTHTRSRSLIQLPYFVRSFALYLFDVSSFFFSLSLSLSHSHVRIPLDASRAAVGGFVIVCPFFPIIFLCVFSFCHRHGIAFRYINSIETSTECNNNTIRSSSKQNELQKSTHVEFVAVNASGAVATAEQRGIDE